MRRNPREIATAIFPVLGPAIRKAIAETMAGLVRTINRAVEHSFSPQGINGASRRGAPACHTRSRHQARAGLSRRAGVPRPRRDGAAARARTRRPSGDADLISGMLTAIRDFVDDSFGPTEAGELSTFTVGEHTVHVEAGPQRAHRRPSIRGQRPEPLPLRLQRRSSRSTSSGATPLADLRGRRGAVRVDAAAARGISRRCCRRTARHSRRGYGDSRGRFPFVLIVPRWSWWATRGGRQWNAALTRLEAEPGIVVIRSERARRKWHLTRLRDPLARNPSLLLASRGVDTTDVVAHWEPYRVHRASRCCSRALVEFLAPPVDVTFSLTAIPWRRRPAPAFWIVRAEAVAPALAGIWLRRLLARRARVCPADMEAMRREVESRRVRSSRQVLTRSTSQRLRQPPSSR